MSESTGVAYSHRSYVFQEDTVDYRVMRDSPAGDAAYSVEAVGDRLGRSGSLEGRARVARGARGHSLQFVSPSTFSTPCLGLEKFVYLLLWAFRTAPTLGFGCVEATLAIVTTTSWVLRFVLGGKWLPGFGTRRLLGGGLSYTSFQCLELIHF